ncbi:MAG: tRNA (adenosine(37)-N6)-dimethylallyltransferase MiaA [Proteobacteria bacterium]|nr:tRNA (adenosine(37)-N6)-dimethylallyltransferase MiaA [Pseudomonadota bacterium]MBU1417086.1 tRNA (adenosine(37)-N6)-dimethylallyltransferase MiaA [Pseudomonadota bacterium]MBU1453782.1 tRNA (adenosine(37)-N6)-dimethylallyltransferase MiaA [Pseudomonadota bacterium]
MFPILAPLVVLVGPTAIGKTALSIRLAQEFDFEIISIDSMQVYRYMDIGTAKISEGEMAGIPHHLIDVVNPDDPFDAGLFEKIALKAILDISSRGKKVLLTGGTGLYLRALLTGLSQNLPNFPDIRKEIQEKLKKQGNDKLHDELSLYDRISAQRIHKNDTHRLVRALEIYRGTGKTWSEFLQEHKENSTIRFPHVLCLGLTCERKVLYQRIEQRTRAMLDSGLQREVLNLLERGYGKELKAMQSIGYKHMIKHLQGEWDYQTMCQNLARDTRRYAKRQYTWFNGIEGLLWFDKSTEQKVLSQVHEHLNKH